MKEIRGSYGVAKVFTNNIEDKAVEQIKILMNQPYAVDANVRIMPDVHAGAGCTIGTTMYICNERICPNLVGVDIGCGVYVVYLNGIKEIDYEKLDRVIRNHIPSGYEIHSSVMIDDPELDELKCDVYWDYIHDIKIVQRYASMNREQMAYIIIDKMGWGKETMVRMYSDQQFHTIHNYIDYDTGRQPILRKGAVSAKKGELLIIPMNMRDGSLICRGKGNPDWNYSAPHGAGRILSRAGAKKEISIADYEKSMSGIYTTSVNEFTLDESPMAYKPMKEIISNIGDTVDILKVIKPVYNFKAIW